MIDLTKLDCPISISGNLLPCISGFSRFTSPKPPTVENIVIDHHFSLRNYQLKPCLLTPGA